MDSTVVRVHNLRRIFHRARRWRAERVETIALDGVSLLVPQGEVHGLLGPNGAGKTTLCKIISTVLLPSSGEVSVLGHDVVAAAPSVRSVIGLVFGGEKGLYTRLTPRQNLLYWAALYDLTASQARVEADRLLERVGMAECADAPVETLSRGMKQRVHLARGLIGDPRVLLLDEPSSGLDPAAALDFRTLIGDLRHEGRTILITTHDMGEAEAVCDRVSFMDRGCLVATLTPRAMTTVTARHRWIEVDEAGERTRSDLATLPGVVSVARRGGVLRVRTEGDDAAELVVRHLLTADAKNVRLVPPSLEDVYLDLVGR